MSILIVFLLVGTVQADSTVFMNGEYAHSRTGRYAINENRSKVLSIADAQELEVIVKGVTEKNHDFLVIYDSNDRLLKKLSGDIEEHFTVIGSSIRVHFRSDGRANEKGVMVSVAARSTATIFNEIKTQLVEATNTILQHGTYQIYSEIGDSLKQFKELHNRVEDASNIEDMIEEVAHSLKAIGQTYRRIAAMKTDILTTHRAQLELIKNLKTSTLSNVDDAEKRQQDYSALLAKAKTELANTTDPLDKEKWQFSVESYENMIKTFRAQETIWNKFHETQGNLETQLREHSRKIEVLLHFLEMNAAVYEQAANVMLLQKNTVAISTKLTDLSKLQTIITKIEESEEVIDKYVQEIQQTTL